MRTFYYDEGPIDTLLQIADGPVRDGDLIGKGHRDEFVQFGWVTRAEGFNLITDYGRKVVYALRLRMAMVPANHPVPGVVREAVGAGRPQSGQMRTVDQCAEANPNDHVTVSRWAGGK